MKGLVAACLLILPLPLAAQEQNDYQKAVAARTEGEFARAIALLDGWLLANPSDSDALVQRGYAHLALGNEAQAKADFDAALALAPSYADARDGLAILRARQSAQSRGFVVAGGAWSALAGNRPDWWEATLSAEAPVSPGLSLGGRASWFQRFGIENVELEGRIAARAAPNLWLRASLGGTPSADFRPEVAAAAGADLRVSEGSHATVVSLDTSFQRFPLQDVVTLTPGITQYFGDGRFWGTIRGIGIIPDGQTIELGVLGRLDFAPREGERYFAGAVRGPDTDLGIVTRVTSVFAGAEWPVTDGLSLMPAVAHEWREVGGDRTEFRIDLRARF
ncbi:MAG: YaiO family outer membrane beta-barrel protein [Erythrobacter sp.]